MKHLLLLIISLLLIGANECNPASITGSTAGNCNSAGLTPVDVRFEPHEFLSPHDSAIYALQWRTSGEASSDWQLADADLVRNPDRVFQANLPANELVDLRVFVFFGELSGPGTERTVHTGICPRITSLDLNQCAGNGQVSASAFFDVGTGPFANNPNVNYRLRWRGPGESSWQVADFAPTHNPSRTINGTLPAAQGLGTIPGYQVIEMQVSATVGLLGWSGPPRVGLVPFCPITDVNGDGAIRLSCGPGASNTDFTGWSWCEQLAENWSGTSWEFEDISLGGRRVDPNVTPTCWDQIPAIENADVDAAVISCGTADIGSNDPPWRIALNILQLRGALVGRGIDTFVGLIPPGYRDFPPLAARVEEVNSLLRGWIPPGRLIDWHTGFSNNDRDQYFDNLHFAEFGQCIRAERAADKLRDSSQPFDFACADELPCNLPLAPCD